jgi:hypothetical protein
MALLQLNLALIAFTHAPSLLSASPQMLSRTAVATPAAAAPTRAGFMGLLAAAPEGEPRPSLAGEKIAATAIVIGIGAAIFSTGLSPSELWAVPGRIVRSPILQKAAKRAIGGGLSGALAGVIQVLTLMWLRTTMNYQYRYGTSTKAAMRTLYEQGGRGLGGLMRFYQGVSFAILQTPLSRFGDTAANTGVLELLALTSWGAALPIGMKTAMASAAGSLWRIGITPLDTLKTTMQVEGKEAKDLLMAKVKREGFTVLYQGGLANALASFVGSYPWFLTFNFAMAHLPAPPPGVLLYKLLRTAVAGVAASCVSDCVSNVIRVLKTTRQTSATTIGYREAAKQIIDKEGLKGLFGRGLGTRLMTNAIQAAMFTVVWKFFEGKMNA